MTLMDRTNRYSVMYRKTFKKYTVSYILKNTIVRQLITGTSLSYYHGLDLE